jgi:CBS domain-containing protein
MKASDVMVTDVITVGPEMTVREAAQLLLDRHISAAPVLDAQGRLIGIVSEGDLIHRAEIGTERRRSWWLEFLVSDQTRANEFIKAHATKVADVMTRNVVTATEDTSLGEIATLLERHGIKRVPIVRSDKVVGIVSRANLLQAFASAPVSVQATTSVNDQALREQVMAHIRAQPWGMPWLMTVNVHDGVVELWGPIDSDEQRRTILVAAESTPGVREVKDNLVRWPASGAR